MRLLAKAWCLLAVVVLPTYGATTNAPSSKYDIEVLVFAVQAPEFEGGELWTRVEQSIDTSEAVLPKELSPSTDFTNIATKLTADGHYRILLEKHWTEVGDTKSSVPPVLLSSGSREINGTLRFYLSRFLHVELNLMFEPQSSLTGADIAPDYVIREQRRVRNKELTYFDHPKFGAIVRVSEVKG